MMHGRLFVSFDNTFLISYLAKESFSGEPLVHVPDMLDHQR